MDVPWQLLPPMLFAAGYACRCLVTSRRVVAAAGCPGWSPAGAGAPLVGQPAAVVWAWLACGLVVLTVRLALAATAAGSVAAVAALLCTVTAAYRHRVARLLAQHDPSWRPAEGRRGDRIRVAMGAAGVVVALVVPLDRDPAVWRLYVLVAAIGLGVVLGLVLFWTQAWLPTQGRLRWSGEAPGPGGSFADRSPGRSEQAAVAGTGTPASTLDAADGEHAAAEPGSPFTTRRSRRRPQSST